MESFKPVTISDKEWVDKLLTGQKCPSLEYNFTTLFLWSDIYKTKIRRHNDKVLVSFGDSGEKFLFPVGKGDPKTSIDLILEMNKGKKITFMAMCEDSKNYLEENYPDQFSFGVNRDMADYIYTTESLMTLSGKKLSSKRNHINRFIENNPDWSYEAITDENMIFVDKMHDEWCEKVQKDADSGLNEETYAVKKAIKYYKELKLSGGLIKANGKVVAFSMGDRLNDSTFLVHIEKAFSEIQGAYPMINKQFVINNCADYEFVNREEDTGDEGLRKAKLSYNPHTILTKYCGTLNL